MFEDGSNADQNRLYANSIYLNLDGKRNNKGTIVVRSVVAADHDDDYCDNKQKKETKPNSNSSLRKSSENSTLQEYL